MPRPLVLTSSESADGTRCVDLFRRDDGTFGFEEYRREPEDPSGWQAVGSYGERVFHSRKEADEAAHAAVAWLGHEIGDVDPFH